MKKKLLTIACATIFAGSAHAGNVNTGNADITVEGGVTAGYFYSADYGNNKDNILLSDFMLEISGGSDTTFAAGIGIINTPTVFDGGVGNYATTGGGPGGLSMGPGDSGLEPDGISANIQYAYLTPTLAKGVTLDLGLLATNIGYEVQQSYANGNILRGAVWNSQPVYYPGIRANVELGGGMSAYVELSDTFPGGNGAAKAGAAGVSGSAGGMDYAVNYRQINKGNGLLDVILATKAGGMDVGVNFDYITTDASGDDDAFGLAVYVTPKAGSLDVPVRVEYFSDGNSGVYGGVDSGYSFTVTPTMAVGKSSFLRVELAYMATDKGDLDGDGTTGDSALSAMLQGGYRF